MGRPRNPVPPPSTNNTTMEELQAEMITKLTSLVEEVRSISSTLKQVKSENAQLKATIQQQADEIAVLKNDNNDRELHARSWSVRVVNLPLPPDQETSNRSSMDTV
jgi:predicted RNase H-like nuclease (RuvC/YqgF family)